MRTVLRTAARAGLAVAALLAAGCSGGPGGSYDQAAGIATAAHPG